MVIFPFWRDLERLYLGVNGHHYGFRRFLSFGSENYDFSRCFHPLHIYFCELDDVVSYLYRIRAFSGAPKSRCKNLIPCPKTFGQNRDSSCLFLEKNFRVSRVSPNRGTFFGSILYKWNIFVYTKYSRTWYDIHHISVTPIPQQK